VCVWPQCHQHRSQTENCPDREQQADGAASSDSSLTVLTFGGNPRTFGTRIVRRTNARIGQPNYRSRGPGRLRLPLSFNRLSRAREPATPFSVRHGPGPQHKGEFQDVRLR
jgi:hypothetical protein